MNESDISAEELIKKSSPPLYSVSPDLNQRVLKMLHNQKVEKEPLKAGITLISALRRLATVGVAALVVFFSTFYYQANSYAYNIGRAKVSLEKLQNIVHSDDFQALDLFIPPSVADDGSAAKVDGDRVVLLSARILKSTEKALAIALRKQLSEAVFREIEEVQSFALEVFSEASLLIVSQKNETLMSDIITQASQSHRQLAGKLDIILPDEVEEELVPYLFSEPPREPDKIQIKPLVGSEPLRIPENFPVEVLPEYPDVQGTTSKPMDEIVEPVDAIIDDASNDLLNTGIAL